MKYIMFILLNIFCFSVFAQTTSLTGTIKLKNGIPVSDAVVIIKELNKNTLTDEEGKFEFSGLSYNSYQIEVFSIEIEKSSFSVDFGKNSHSFDLVVESSMMSLNEVVVTSISKKRAIETKGFAVNVVETQKFATQAIRVNELLDRAAGVRVRQDGGLGSRSQYNVNGLSGDAIRIFIDGVPASNFGSSFSLNSIPPALIERIEVYKGVVPGYLAEDALGGAVNIILKHRVKNSLVTSYSVGSFNTHQWDIAGSHRWDNGLTFDASGYYNYSDNNYKVWGDDIFFVDYKGNITESNGKRMKRFHDAYESWGTKFNVGFTDVKWADRFLVGGIFSKDYNEIQHGATMRVVYGDRHSRSRSAVANVNYDKKDLFVEGLSLKIDASHSYINKQAIDTVGIMHDWAGPVLDEDGSYKKYNSGAELGNAKSALIDKDHSNVLRTNLSYTINNNHSLYINYLFTDFQRKSFNEYQPLALQKLNSTRDLQKNVVSFTYQHIAFSGKLRTSAFYKYYNQTVTSNDPYLDDKEYKINTIRKKTVHNGYGVTLSYALLPDLYLLGSAENTLRFPNSEELFGNVSEGLYEAYGLKSEKGLNVNLGVNYVYTTGDHSFGANTSFFFRDTKDMIRLAVKYGSFDTAVYENLENVLSKGIDAELCYNYANTIDFRFNISKFDVLFNTKYDKTGNPFQYFRKQIRNEPSFKFNSNITYFRNDLFQKNSRASISFNINYVKSFLRNWANVGSTNLSVIPTQYPMDIGIIYNFPKNKFVVSFDMKNILDKQVFDNYGLQKPGRAFYTKVTYFL